MADLLFRIEIPRPAASELLVRLRVSTADLELERSRSGAELILFMPTWTPGSYLIREYSRHVVGVSATDVDTGASLPCAKAAKNRWAVTLTATTRGVDVEYTVYCHELSVRTADVTTDHAFWNNACVLMWPIGRRRDTCDITVQTPAEWRISTALRTTQEELSADGSTRDVTLRACGMDEAFDSPIMAGRQQVLQWVSCGVPHSLAVDGLEGIDLPESLLGDLDRIVRASASIFGGALPYAHFTFLCLLSQDGHGGLEHANSTTLLHPRTQLRNRKGYIELLSLAAHELFHAWNVKRMRPVEFVELSYETETYTRFLWMIEGWTAYFDDLICLRAGVYCVDEYLAAMGKNVQAFLSNPGRFRTSLADSSYDAWIRLYRPDENTRNSSQNYYGNGAVAAMCLDLVLRESSAGERSLDDVVRTLYAASGSGSGYTLAEVLRVVEQAGGHAAKEFLVASTSGAFDPPLRELLMTHGIALSLKDLGQPQLGVQFEPGHTVISSVGRQSAAWTAGIMPGDEVIAINGLRVDAPRWSEIFGAVAVTNRELDLLIARRGVVKTIRATPSSSPGLATLEPMTSADAKSRSLRERWLESGGSDRKAGRD